MAFVFIPVQGQHHCCSVAQRLSVLSLHASSMTVTLVTVFFVQCLRSLHYEHVCSKWLACVVCDSFVKTATPSSDTTAGPNASDTLK